jgi:hypothetical protein
MYEIFDLFEIEILLLHKNMQPKVIKVIKYFKNFLEVFCCMASSQHDGYHVGTTLQSFAYYEKFGEMQECNLISI